MRLIDSHAHLSALKGDLAKSLNRAVEAGVAAIVNIATTPQELDLGVTIDSTTPKIFHAAATTPHDVQEQGGDFELFRQHVKELVAIGETGLDYHYDYSPRELQQTYLRKYLKLAAENDLPVIFHCREAFADLFRIVEEENYKGKALLHCFTGTTEEALSCVERGWMVSFSGIVTFKKSEELRESAKAVPIEKLLIETDAPYLAPQSQRGSPNEPAFLIETARCLSELKRLSVEAFAETTSNNAAEFFKLTC